MTYRDSIHFSFDGELSTDYFVNNLIIGGGGLIEEELLPARTPIIEQIRGRTERYFYGFEYEPRKLLLQLAFESKFTDMQLQQIARWLFKDYYKPLIFAGKPNRIYYALAVNDPKIFHTQLKDGYLEVEFQCNGPYVYSPVYNTGALDFSVNPETLTHTFINEGDLVCKPTVIIKKIGNGNLSIKNTSHHGQEMVFTDLLDEEVLIVDCEAESIVSDIPFINRNEAHNGQFLSFIRGHNYLLITGTCIVEFKYEFTFYT